MKLDLAKQCECCDGCGWQWVDGWRICMWCDGCGTDIGIDGKALAEHLELVYGLKPLPRTVKEKPDWIPV